MSRTSVVTPAFVGEFTDAAGSFFIAAHQLANSPLRVIACAAIGGIEATVKLKMIRIILTIKSSQPVELPANCIRQNNRPLDSHLVHRIHPLRHVFLGLSIDMGMH